MKLRLVFLNYQQKYRNEAKEPIDLYLLSAPVGKNFVCEKKNTYSVGKETQRIRCGEEIFMYEQWYVALADHKINTHIYIYLVHMQIHAKYESKEAEEQVKYAQDAYHFCKIATLIAVNIFVCHRFIAFPGDYDEIISRIVRGNGQVHFQQTKLQLSQW